MPASIDQPKVVSAQGGTLYWNDTNDVSAVNADGSIASGSSYLFTSGQWFYGPGVSVGISDGQVPERRERRYGTLEVFGTSYTRTTGASEAGYAWQNRLASMVGAQRVYNYGRGSAKTHDPTLGVGYVREQLLRTRTGAPYYPASELCAVTYGINDLTVVADARFFTQSLRALVSLVNASAVFEENDATVAHSAGSRVQIATANAAAGVAYNGGYEQQITTNGATTTITLPSDFPGGTVNLSFRVTSADTVVGTVKVDGVNASFTDGSAAGVLSYAPADYCGESNPGTCVKRIGGLAAGARSIVITYTTITGTARFDRYAIEANPLPVVALMNVARIPSPSGSGYTESDARVALWNQALPAVAAEFPNVVLVDIDTPLGGVSGNFSDGRHPNDKGHAIMAKAIYDSLPARRAEAVLGGHFDNCTTGLTLATNWTSGAGSTSPAALAVRPGGLVQLNGYFKKSTLPSANEVIATLPVGCRPYYTQFFTVQGDASNTIQLRVDGTAGVPGGTVAGALKHVSGAASGESFGVSTVIYQADR